ncbi:LptF/LptG family permease, partial [Acinetobacter baumannii]
WHRIIQPFASLVMMLLALPFIFGPLRQTSNSIRLVIGLVIGFCFYYANQFFGPIVLLFHWPALLGALLPSLLFGIVG